jgi:hypothetical protein
MRVKMDAMTSRVRIPSPTPKTTCLPISRGQIRRGTVRHELRWTSERSKL